MTVSGPGGVVGVAIAGLVIIGILTWRDVRYICLFPYSTGIAHEYLGPATVGFGAVFLAGALSNVFDGPFRIVLYVIAGLGVLTFLVALTLGQRRPPEDEDRKL